MQKVKGIRDENDVPCETNRRGSLALDVRFR